MKRALMALLLFSCGAFAQETAPAPAARPVFDIHVHLHDGGESLRAYKADAESARVELAGIGVMWFGGPNQAPAGDPDDIRARNDALIELAAEHPGAMPIGTVHPYDGQAALDELERIAGRGVKVIKLHAHTQQFDVTDPRLLALVRKAGELDMVVLMDNANIVAGDSENLFTLAIRAQQTKFVFAHAGGLNFRFWNILPLARTAEGLELENVYFDISGTVLLAADSPIEKEFLWTLRNVGIDSLILGSDYPQISLARTLEAFEKLDLTEEEKTKIRSGNARRLFDL
ncbi:amidohydrolase family protein [Marilutibacter chinensis]|uniref:Amidohydrolase family protein n=1 Tax=Marilutibacter chinensis TaxID=2912247 RepID=A0ABS9HXM4_9GAMM|nr:amidohydrolase family protein [Lysobacter chinensis]MCF7223122.1 amidohydrolase family protein [Lysobacter chinensis]